MMNDNFTSYRNRETEKRGKMKRFLFLAAVIGFMMVAQTAGQAVKGGRVKYNFNSDWKLFAGDAPGAESFGFDDGSWKTVTTPRAWNEDDAFRKDIKDLSTGIAWYRKRFRLPGGAADKKIFLEFEGIRQAGEFYLNGKFIGRHEN